MNRLTWQASRHTLLAGPMDETHREFVVLTNLLAEADDAEEVHCLERLIVHCEAHFAQESRWMREYHAYDPESHRIDHDVALSLLHDALAEVRRGRAGAGRALAGTLGEWFGRHTDTMDAALAFQMQQQTRAARVAGLQPVG